MLITKRISLLIWIVIIFLLTCVSDIRQLLSLRDLAFTIQASPDLSAFFSPLPELTNRFILQKLGHVFAFFLLTILARQCFQSYRSAAFYCILYGLLTEFLQLYFSRGGRLFDVWFDAAGVIIGFLYLAFVQRVKRNTDVAEWRSREFN